MIPAAGGIQDGPDTSVILEARELSKAIGILSKNSRAKLKTFPLTKTWHNLGTNKDKNANELKHIKNT